MVFAIVSISRWMEGIKAPDLIPLRHIYRERTWSGCEVDAADFLDVLESRIILEH